MSELHLWEYDHPYYCSETNFRVRRDQHNGNHLRWDSWQQFVEEGWASNDPDMNLLFRWDWHKFEPDEDEPDQLCLFFMLQRKGDFWAHTITVTDEDESAVRTWLAERAKTITAIWEPILAGQQGGAA